MEILDSVLRYDEKIMLRLRELYIRHGYDMYRMSRFEEYELYAHNKNFLVSDNIITFTGRGGKLLALRPDVTLSIAKNTPDGENVKKLYYNENVYRPGGLGHEFKERMQAGLECIGNVGVSDTAEVIMLAEQSLGVISDTYCLDISHMGFIGGLLECAGVRGEVADDLMHRVGEKNAPEIARLCSEHRLTDDLRNRLTALAALRGAPRSVEKELMELSACDKSDAALNELRGIFAAAETLGAAARLCLDFSLISDMSYYSGVIFQGFIEGIPAAVLSGGRYDSLMRRLGKSSGAIGFAVYLDMLERLDEDAKDAQTFFKKV